MKAGDINTSYGVGCPSSACRMVQDSFKVFDATLERVVRSAFKTFKTAICAAASRAAAAKTKTPFGLFLLTLTTIDKNKQAFLSQLFVFDSEGKASRSITREKIPLNWRGGSTPGV